MWAMSKNGQKQSLNSQLCCLGAAFFRRFPDFLAAGRLDEADFLADLRAGARLRLDRELELDFRAAIGIIKGSRTGGLSA